MKKTLFSVIKLMTNACTWLANGQPPVIATHTQDKVLLALQAVEIYYFMVNFGKYAMHTVVK